MLTAQTFEVTTLADQNDGAANGMSLREAILAANTNGNTEADTISFLSGLTGTIALDNGQLPAITTPITIQGLGADVLAISGKNLSRVFEVTSGSLTLNDLTVTKGNAGALNGGGILSTGSLTLQNTKIIDNNATGGGGLYSNNAHVTITNTTFEGNTAVHGGGARIGVQTTTEVNISGSTFHDNKAYVVTGGATSGALMIVGASNSPVTIVNSTFSGNEADTAGALRIRSGANVKLLHNTITDNMATSSSGGLSIENSSIVAQNSIITENTAPTSANVGGNLATNTYNLINQPAGLAPLGDYGGPTKTHALLPGSDAINAGNNATSSAAPTDQRGFARYGSVVDIGAAEVSQSHTLDADGDHRDDFLQFDAGTGTVLVVTHPSGVPNIKLWAELDDTVSWVNLKTGDFNGDGRDDFVVQNDVTNAWTFGISDGNQFLVSSSNAIGDWTTTFVGDFDNDDSQELLGKLADGSWDILRYKEGLGASVIDVGGTPLTPSATAYAGDANRDGRDDIIYLSGGTWSVALAQAGGTSFSAATPWGSWFASEYTQSINENRKFNADAPYKKVLDIFSDIYNNYELELYPGLMKGPDATEDTKAGNAWDQAALLVEKLEAALPSFAGDISIVSGKVRVSAAELAKWLGTDSKISVDIGSGVIIERDNALAPFNVIKSAMDGNAKPVNAAGVDVRVPGDPANDAYNISRYATAIEFTHVWVKAKVPIGDGFAIVNLDPSWKFKERREGIDLGALGFNANNTQGIFDEYEYLANDPTTDHRLPVEFFEDELMDYLAQHRPGMSLADVPKDGPIIRQSFDVLPGGTGTNLGTGIESVGTLETYANYDAIKSNSAIAHSVKLSVDRENPLSIEDTNLTDLGAYASSIGPYNLHPGPAPVPATNQAFNFTQNTPGNLQPYVGKDAGASPNPGYSYTVPLINKTLYPYLPLDDPSTLDVVPSSLLAPHIGMGLSGQGTAGISNGQINLAVAANQDYVIKAIPIPAYNITANTRIRFDFSSTDKGAIHGFGLSTDHYAWSNNSQFHRIWTGSTGSGVTLNSLPNPVASSISYSVGSGISRYEIPIGNVWMYDGEFLSPRATAGPIEYLYIFVEAETSTSPPSNGTANSTFGNIQFYEEPNPFGGNIPTGSTGAIIMEGHQYKRLPINGSTGYEISQYTVLEFDFASTINGDVHAIGWDGNDVADSTDGNLSHIYQIHGTDTTFDAEYKGYTLGHPTSPGYKTFRIEIGKDLTPGEPVAILKNLVFVHDGPVYTGSGTGEQYWSSFKNVRLYEPEAPLAQSATHVTANDAIKLAGTQFKTLNLSNPYTIEEDSVLYFRFSSGSQGLNHYIGWDTDEQYGNGLSTSLEYLQKIYGTSNDYVPPEIRYTSGGSAQLIPIPIGKLYNGEFVGKSISRLVFGVEGGTNQSAESIFSKVGLWTPSGSYDVLNNTVLRTFDTAYASIPVDHVIKPYTRLSFDFRNTGGVGRIHGVILDTNNSSTDTVLRTFQLFGTETNYNYDQSHNLGTNTQAGAWQTFDFPIGAINNLVGDEINRIIFFTDSGPFVSDANTLFKSIRIKDDIDLSEVSKTATLFVPQVSLKPIQFQMNGSASSGYQSRLYVGTDQVWSTDNAYYQGDKAEITVEHIKPSKFGIEGPGRTYTYYQEVDEIISLGLDANQHSRSSLDLMQSQLIAAMGNNNSESDYVDDIDDLLSYTTAKYWYDFNKSNDIIAGLTGTVSGQGYVGSGIAKAKRDLLVETAGSNDYVIEHLPYLIAPVDMGVDLPNATHSTFDTTTGGSNKEAFQLIGYNSSALEHNIVEETINSESVSTMKGLQLAMKNADAQVYVLESAVVDGVRQIKHISTLDRNSSGNLTVSNVNQSITNSTYLTNSASGLLKDYLAEQSSFANSIFSKLNAPITDGYIRMLLPSDPTVLGLWEGAVYTRERTSTLGFLIQKSDAESTSGGDSINIYNPRNPLLPPANHTYATWAGDPVNTANGNMFRDDVDIVFPNIGVPLDFKRHYDANSKDDIGMGVGWVHSFGDVLIADPADTNTGDGQDLIWITSSGQRHKIKASGATYTLPAELHGKFEFISAESKYMYKDKSGLEHHFDNKTSTENGVQVRGRLINILDNIGNGVKITYQTASNVRRIATVEDVHNSNRRLDFIYDTSVTITNPGTSNPSVVGNRIMEIRKVVDAATVGIWNLTYRSPKIDSKNHLQSVVAPSVTVVDSAGNPTPVNPMTTYAYYVSGHNKGVIEKITEADGGIHTYEYYPNGRVFRVTDAEGHKQTFSYNLLRNSTEFTDENGNVETYFHQDNGLLVKQIHDDRTRQEFTWDQDDAEQYLMTSSTDEVGAVETFSYYGNAGFRYRELYETTEKHFPNDTTPLVTRFDYTSPTNRQHMLNLSSIIVDPGTAPEHKNFTAQNSYDSLGRLWKTVDAMGNVTTRTFYNGEGSLHEEGLVLTETTARGNDFSSTNVDAEAVSWELLKDSITISSGTLSVRAKNDNTGYVIADAIRIERIGDYPYTAIIDDDADGINNSFHVIGTNERFSNLNHSYNGDCIVLQANGAKATWTFTGLESGNYRVYATWQLANNRSAESKFEVVDGTVFTDIPANLISVNQKEAPDGPGPGFLTTFSYDDEGYVTWAATDNFEPTVSYYYHTGAIDTSTDPAGVRNRYTYDALGRRTSAILDYGNGTPGMTSQFKYDKSGRLRISTDPLDRVTQFEYDLKGKLVKQINADGLFVEFDYDGFGNRVSQIDELGRETKFRYDSRNRLIETIYCDGTNTRLEYNGVGQIAASIDELGRKTMFTYDAAGRLLTTTHVRTDGPNITASNEYDHLGRLVKAFDFKQNLTEFKHDKLGRVTESRTIAFGGTALLTLTTTDYDANGNVTRVVSYDTSTTGLNLTTANVPADPRTLVTTGNKTANLVHEVVTQYDTLDRPITTVNADGTSTRTVYDLAGRVLYQLDELNRRTKFEYDSYGRLWKTIAPDPDGASLPQTSPITEYKYDAAGNQVAVIDARGNTTHFDYDINNRLVTTTDALGGQQHTLYDIAGQVVAAVDALGRVAYTLRDKRGRAILQREADPDGDGAQTAPETRFEYYENGNLKSKTDALGNETVYEYDELNRLKRETFTHVTPIILDSTSIDFHITKSDGTPTTLAEGFQGNTTLIDSAPTGNDNQRRATAHWEFKNLEAGLYRILATWPGSNDPAIASTVSVRFYEESILQTPLPSGFDSNHQKATDDVVRYDEGGSRGWVVIGQDNLPSLNSFKVEFNSPADKKILADAVRLERLDVVDREYFYDDNGNLTSEKDTFNRETTYAYDGLNRRTKVTTPDPDGAGANVALVTDTVYDGYGNVKKTIESRGGQPRETHFTYDARNRLLTTTVAANDSTLATTTKFEYDAVGNLKQRIEDYAQTPTDQINAKTEYDYDALNRQTVVKRYRSDSDALPLLTTTAYDAVGNVTSTTESVRQVVSGTLREHQSTTVFTYDALNRLSSSTEQDGVAWVPLHEAFVITGDTLSIRLTNTTLNKIVIADAIRIDRLGPNGEILDTRIIDDDKTGADPRFTAGPGPLYDSSSPLEYGGDTTFTGSVTTSAARFATWTFTGLSAGTYRVSATWVRDTQHSDSAANYEIFNGSVGSSADQVVVINQTKLPYDSVSFPGFFTGATTTFTYDAIGNLITETNPLGQTTTSEYDRLNRLVKTTSPDPDGMLSPAPSSQTLYAYDPLGQLVATTNGEGEIERTTYDSLGNVVRSVDGLGSATLSRYDSEGNLLRYIDPAGNVTDYTYDNLNRLKTDTITLSTGPAVRTYKYDNRGNLTEKTDREGRVTDYQYDLLDRVLSENSYSTPGETKFWQYDNLGRVILSGNSDNSSFSYIDEFQYDDLGRITYQESYVESQIQGLQPRTIQTYQYDVLNAADWQQFVRTIYSQHVYDSLDNETFSGITTTLVDPLGRVARFEDTPAGQATKKVEYTYDAANRVIEVARSFSFNTRYEYDQAGRLTEIGHYRYGAATPFVGYAYEYDRADRIVKQTTTNDFGSSDVEGTKVEDFTFDKAGQLTGNDSSISTPDQTFGQDEIFAYDENGNRKNGGFVSGAHNRLMEDADYTYLYDKEGNRIRRTAKVGGAYTVYVWDAHHRLFQAQDYNAANVLQETITYRYDAGDRLIARQAADFTVNPVVSHNEQYRYHGADLALTLDGNDQPLHRYTWAAGIDQLLTDEVFDEQGQLDDTLWAVTDHLGSVNDLLDNGERVIEHREYDSFGVIDEIFGLMEGEYYPGFEPLSDIGHAGSLWDGDAGFYRKGNRPYDPYTSQFLTTDFGGFIDGPNLYWYAHNNPIIYFDPSGFTAIKPTDNVMFGGYGSGVINGPPKAFSFNPIIDLGPKQSPIPASTFSATSLMDRSYGKPAPAIRNVDYLNTGSISPAFDPYGGNWVPPASSTSTPSRASRSFYEGSTLEMVVNTAGGALYGLGQGAKNVAIATAKAPFIAAHEFVTLPIDGIGVTADALSGGRLGYQEWSYTGQAYNPNQSAAMQTGRRALALGTLNSSEIAIAAYQGDADAAANAAGNSIFAAAGARALTARQSPSVSPNRSTFYDVADNGIDLASYTPSNVARTNAQLVQDIAIRAEAKIGRTGRLAGTDKHVYAKRVLDRYQDMFGHRGLQTEVSVIGGKEFPYGTAGSVRLDVIDGPVSNPTAIYDYKFGRAGLTPARINHIQNVTDYGPSTFIIEVRP